MKLRDIKAKDELIVLFDREGRVIDKLKLRESYQDCMDLDVIEKRFGAIRSDRNLMFAFHTIHVKLDILDDSILYKGKKLGFGDVEFI